MKIVENRAVSVGAFCAGALALNGVCALLIVPRFGAQARCGAARQKLLHTEGMQEWHNFQTNTPSVFVPELFSKSLARGRVPLLPGESFHCVIPLSTRGATKKGQTIRFRIGFHESTSSPHQNVLWSDPVSVQVRKERLRN